MKFSNFVMRQIESKKEMTEFFERNLFRGQEAEEIYSILLNQGYSKSMINECYNQALSNIRRKKDEERQKDMEEQRKNEVPMPEVVVDKKPGFFGKFFGKK